MDPVFIFAMICATPILVAVIWFIYNAYQSIEHTVIAGKALRAQVLGGEAFSRQQRLQQLPELPLPVVNYSRNNAVITSDSIPAGGANALLDCFERHVIAAKKEGLFFARLPSDRGRGDDETSMLIGYQASLMIRFYGWISLERRGADLEWFLKCSEVRLWRTPTEEASHFEYDRNQDERVKHQADKLLGDEWIVGILNFLTLNFTTKTDAKKATWFKEDLEKMWMIALYESEPDIPNPAESVDAPPQPQGIERHSARLRLLAAASNEQSAGSLEKTGAPNFTPVGGADSTGGTTPPPKLKRRLREVDGE